MINNITPSIFLFNYSHMNNRVAPIGQPQDNSVQSLHPTCNKSKATISMHGLMRTCKICLQEQQPQTCILSVLSEHDLDENELIIACECKGSVAYVHQKCIKLWIQKQNKTNKTKRAFCQICKCQIFFKKTKIKYWECTLANLCETSACNIISLVIQLVLIGVLSLVQYNLQRLANYEILRNTLLALLGVVSLICLITIFLIIKETFLKTRTQIHKIYSLQESERLGLIQPRQKNKQPLLSIIGKVKKRKITRQRRESKRPSVPFGQISPQLMLVQAAFL